MPVTVGADAVICMYPYEYVWLLPIHISGPETKHIYSFYRDRLGFYAKKSHSFWDSVAMTLCWLSGSENS